MDIKTILDIEISETILNVDSNNRVIKSYLLEDCQFISNEIYYPKVKIFSHSNKNTYNPINEKILSLEKLNLNEKQNFELKKSNSIVSIPVFYFIYNTENYYHFIYDTLPYLITYNQLKKEKPDLKLLINYPNNQLNRIYNFVTEFLEIVGIDKDCLLFVDDTTIYKKVYISSSFTHGINSNLPPRIEIYGFYKKIVESKINDFKSSFPKKSYISRRSWKHNDFSNIGTNYTYKRRMTNEDDLVDLLVRNGYTEVFTEKLNTIEKLGLFFNSEVVVGAIGGGICNVLFSKPETKLISIVSPTFLNVNERFKYSLDCVDTNYFMDTFHSETTSYKTGMRIQSNELSIVGEIVEVDGDYLTVIYSDYAVSGWNSQIEFKKIKLESKLCEKLDDGLNSPFYVDIEKFKNSFSLY